MVVAKMMSAPACTTSRAAAGSAATSPWVKRTPMLNCSRDQSEGDQGDDPVQQAGTSFSSLARIYGREC